MRAIAWALMKLTELIRKQPLAAAFAISFKRRLLDRLWDRLRDRLRVRLWGRLRVRVRGKRVMVRVRLQGYR